MLAALGYLTYSPNADSRLYSYENKQTKQKPTNQTIKPGACLSRRENSLCIRLRQSLAMFCLSSETGSSSKYRSPSMSLYPIAQTWERWIGRGEERRGRKMRGRNGGGERVRSIFSERERHSPRVCEWACWWSLCVRECAGEGGVCSRNVWGGLVPYGRLQAGSSWRGGGAAAGAGELPCFLSQSQNPGIDWVRIPHPVEVWLLLLKQAGRQNPPQQRGVDQIGFLDL